MKNTSRLLNISKIVSIIAILTIISYLIINLINCNNVYAVTQTRENLSDKINNYPGYAELINKLKASHPNWNFRILYTGLDWNQVIKNEATHGRNLVSSSKTGAWVCSVCGNKSYDTGWKCASEATISYYMDPRNSLNEDYVFQFEALSFNESIQTIEGVKKILSDVGYMQGNTITYTKTDGKTGTINKSYAQVIMETAKEANVSPYHLAARIRQEQGVGNTPGVLARGTYPGFVGYYNFFNIGASGNGEAQVIQNGLTRAKNNGLTDPEKSIKYGAKFIAEGYISKGQDTAYLQKFDVDNTDGIMFYHQYMQNVSASKSEGTRARNSYNSLGLLNASIDFIIPVYENMPTTACAQPGSDTIVTQDVKVKGTNVNVREGKSSSSRAIATVNTGDVLLKIEVATSTQGGYYWDKVVLPNGQKGYIARSYIVNIADVTNCNDSVIANTAVNLRNGPGTDGTIVVTTLVEGQACTRIEQGKYNLNGYIWDRVVLSDGKKGYVARNYLNASNGGTNTNNGSELVKVICPSGLKVRSAPGTDKTMSKYLNKGEVVTRIQKDVSRANGYVWDKIVTSDGITGYIARGDSSGAYIEVVQSNTPTPPTEVEKIEEFKIEEEKLIGTPDLTIEYVKGKNAGKNIVIKDSKGKVVETGNIGTGYKVTIDKKEYTVVKYGDTNGDGRVNSADALDILKQSVQMINKTNEYLEAMDTNKDGKVNSADALLVLKKAVGLSQIAL